LSLMKSLNRLNKLATTALTFSLAFYNTILISTLLRLSIDVMLQMEDDGDYELSIY
jgi:hypothetical protein